MIKNIMLLTKISTRNFLQNLNLLDKKTKKINKKSTYVWLIIILVIAISFLSNEILNILEDYGQMSIFLNILFTIAIIIMFMQTIIASMNILYFSKDLEYFLPTPIKSEELLLSKVNTIMNILYGTEILFMLIPLLLYGISTAASFSYYLYVILALVLLPIFPVVLVSIVTLIIMKFIKTIKNKNKFQIFITLFFIFLIVFAEILFIKMVTSSQFNYDTMGINVNNISENINRSMIVINPLISILNQNQVFINLLKVIVIYVIMYAILIGIGKRTYIKSILKTTGYNKNKHKKEIDFETQCETQSPLKSYVKNDFKNFIKNAIFFMQTIYPICMTMIMFIILTIYFKIGIIEKNQELSGLLGEMSLTIEGVCLILGIIQVLCSMVSISITAISRQGSNAIFMKYIPIHLYKQFLLKNVPQLIVNMIISIIVLILSKILFPMISIIDIILIFIVSMIFSIINSFLMLIVDIKRPILDWKAEIDVFKQNENKIFQYVWTITVVVLLMYIKRAFENLNLYIGILATFMIFLVILCIINIYVKKQIKKNKLFKNII